MTTGGWSAAEKFGIVVGILSGVLGIIVYVRTLALHKAVVASTDKANTPDGGA